MPGRSHINHIFVVQGCIVRYEPGEPILRGEFFARPVRHVAFYGV
jgi:hypothetical protein